MPFFDVFSFFFFFGDRLQDVEGTISLLFLQRAVFSGNICLHHIAETGYHIHTHNIFYAINVLSEHRSANVKRW